jgi:hypothetical protein
MTRNIPRKLVVKTNELAADDNDLSTPRYWRDPSYPSGTGKRAPLVRVEWIKVPNHPDYFAASGERCSRLWWCETCKSYEHADSHACTQKNRECADDSHDYY